MRRIIELILMLVLSINEPSSNSNGSLPLYDLTFNGSSDELKTTQIVPTLDTLIPEGKNAIWCASFLSAWKTLENDFVGEPIALEESPQIAGSLNVAPDPRPYIPEYSLYTAVGWKQEGIVERIIEDLKRKFPAKEAPSFPGMAENSFIAYSYLEASVTFAVPYFQNDSPLPFTDSKGEKTMLSSFGIRSEDEYAYYRLRRQPQVLFQKGGQGDKDFDFAIDLCTYSSPNQIVVARIEREQTLASALDQINQEINKMSELKKENAKYAKYVQQIGPNDVLLVPDLFWQLSHHFSELEGKTFKNQKLEGQRLDIAQQDIMFRLDRSGAELKSESKTLLSPLPRHFVFDRPFLIYMKKRDANLPYFAMWVDNSELLRPWDEINTP